jgi:RND family efflux transporter MFP subunit
MWLDRSMRRLALAIVVAGGAAACDRGAAPAEPGAGAAASSAPQAASAAASASVGPPVAVTTVRAQLRDMPVDVEATGTVTAVASVDIKPQVSSVVKQMYARDGQFVRTGDLLFTLDARSDEANVAKLQAQVARDEVSLADAQRQLERSKDLVAKNFVSQAAVDSSQALVDAQAAALRADRAAVDAAKVALSYARITAPAAGRVGVVAVSVGSAVVANQTTLLTITQIDPIDVSFALPQRDLADVLAAGAAKVVASLPEGRGTLEGRLNFVDNAVDAASGTVKVKARFENAKAALWPGAFVKASLVLRTLKESVVVPQAAVIQGPRGPFVYAVVDGRAVPRPVELIAARGDDAAVRGVRAGESIVLDGRQNLRQGSAVIERTREAGGTGKGGRAPAAAASAGSGVRSSP